MKSDLSPAQDLPPLVLRYARHIGAEFGVGLEAIRGPSRDDAVVDARHFLIWALLFGAKAPPQDIVRWVGRCHSTIIHACSKVERMRRASPEVKRLSEPLLKLGVA